MFVLKEQLFDEARKQLQEIIENKPFHPYYYTLMARIYSDEGKDYDKAHEYYFKAIQMTNEEFPHKHLQDTSFTSLSHPKKTISKTHLKFFVLGIAIFILINP